jgi:phosphoribosylformylglycinamidine cyclo-ligase
VIEPNTSYITGSMVGIVRPKQRACWGESLQAGDVILGLASSGIHSNGLTLARRIAEHLPRGYLTPFTASAGTESGWTLGQELLTPTRIYVRPVMEMFEAGVDLHYLSNITGHGWRKVMRCRYPFTYVIDSLPELPSIFRLLQKWGKVSDEEAYQTWNMGVGFCLFAPQGEAERIEGICARHGISAMRLGHVEAGEKQVLIRPLQITYSST